MKMDSKILHKRIITLLFMMFSNHQISSLLIFIKEYYEVIKNIFLIIFLNFLKYNYFIFSNNFYKYIIYVIQFIIFSNYFFCNYKLINYCNIKIYLYNVNVIKIA